MKGKLILLLAAGLLALALVGITSAASTRYIHVKPGAKIVASNGFACLVTRTTISCSHRRHSNLMAMVEFRGVGITVNGRPRFICLNNGRCRQFH